jgi:hypothetical protein
MLILISKEENSINNNLFQNENILKSTNFINENLVQNDYIISKNENILSLVIYGFQFRKSNFFALRMIFDSIYFKCQLTGAYDQTSNIYLKVASSYFVNDFFLFCFGGKTGEFWIGSLTYPRMYIYRNYSTKILLNNLLLLEFDSNTIFEVFYFVFFLKNLWKYFSAAIGLTYIESADFGLKVNLDFLYYDYFSIITTNYFFKNNILFRYNLIILEAIMFSFNRRFITNYGIETKLDIFIEIFQFLKFENQFLYFLKYVLSLYIYIKPFSKEFFIIISVNISKCILQVNVSKDLVLSLTIFINSSFSKSFYT